MCACLRKSEDSFLIDVRAALTSLLVVSTLRSASDSLTQGSRENFLCARLDQASKSSSGRLGLKIIVVHLCAGLSCDVNSYSLVAYVVTGDPVIFRLRSATLRLCSRSYLA